MWRGKCAVRARYVLVPATALCISLLAEGSAGALKRCQNQDWPSDAFSELTIAHQHHPRQESESLREVLAVNSSQVRAITGHQKNDFRSIPFDPPPPKLRTKHSRGKKSSSGAVSEISYPAKQKFGLEADGDRATRRVFARKPDGSPILTIVSCCEPLMALLSHVA